MTDVAFHARNVMPPAMSAFRVANGGPAAVPTPPHAHTHASTFSTPTPAPSAPKSRMGAAMAPSTTTAVQLAAVQNIPLSARKAPPLDLDTVERRRPAAPVPEIPPRPNRMFGLEEAPTYRPTEEEFKDPIQYIAKIGPEASKYGIAKIVPPASWAPDFPVDTERFHFKTRRQELNSIEGGTRANLNYLDQLTKFHKQHGHNLTRFPSVDKRPLDLYKLKKAVETRGGFERVCKQKKWAEIGRDLGYRGKIMSSLSTSLKNSYQKWLHPYEEYLRVVKPGVQQRLEMENGGPFTPSPAQSPLKKSTQPTPATHPNNSPAAQASAALHTPFTAQHPPIPHPALSGGFTAVNSGGFTAVNTQAQGSPPVLSATTSFAAVNGYDNADSRTSTPLRNGPSPMLSAHNTPDLRPSGVGLTPMSNGHASTQLKRTLSQDTENVVNCDNDGANGRRSKRMRKEAAPTVAGSHMTQPRMSTPQPLNVRTRPIEDRPGERCETCGSGGDEENILLCESCDAGYHGYCLDPPIHGNIEHDWHCPKCLVGTGEFGFEEGGIYSLRQFQEKAQQFKENHFANKMPFDPVTNARRSVTEDDVEREFWRLVESITETVEVEYGADIHSTTHGSGFPTIERHPRDLYSYNPWNLNILPYHAESLFRHIKSDISGMTVPWLYVGMVFSTFCWHNEDHYSYSANYQHFGATKTWYGIPAEDAEKFEQAMRDAVPELFESQPDLLFQLVTLLTPDQLKKAGVRVYALDQRAGEFVITFPQAYHAGFNHGFNFNEAVNFAPSDWEPYGELGVQRLLDYRRQPCFSHDELLLAAASRKDVSIKTAKWLAPALKRMQNRENETRDTFLNEAGRELYPKIDAQDAPEEELVCAYCKCYGYLSRFLCTKTNKTLCLRHAPHYECCSPADVRSRLNAGGHSVIYRMTNLDLGSVVQKISEKADTPEAWEAKLDAALKDTPTPQLKVLRALVNEGEKIDWDLHGLYDLKSYVERCSEVAEEAHNYTTRKQLNRRKNDRTVRGRGSIVGKSGATVAEVDDREREFRKLENMQELLRTAEKLSFESPEVTALGERWESIADFQKKAQTTLRDSPTQSGIEKLEELLEEGRSFNMDIPELESIDRVVLKLKWLRSASELQGKPCTLQDVADLIKEGLEVGMPEQHPQIRFFEDQKAQGEIWEAKAKELIRVDNVHYQQLDALSKQANSIPVTTETLSAVEAILKKQRDAQEQIMSLYERSKDADFRKRPKYKDVRDAMEHLNTLNSKPPGTIDLEKEQKRHEDWMRRGKKLFGKANAPLHILHAHMKQVDERNRACFDLDDTPRVPVEPASREVSPAEGTAVDGSGSSRDVFCICRKPEAGMMIECELCHEWYHGKCFKLARGKVKEDDKYTCPICDYRVKIPRDATRPKLEDLIGWQDEVPTLPFQPEEEETLDSIIDNGLKFRHFVTKFMNPMMSTPSDLTEHRFYLRKLEGADILLAEEINFFRAELHRWAPVAPFPPPPINVSLSTRKPRPTKQQKIMRDLGISNPNDIPPNLRTKNHNQFTRPPFDDRRTRRPQDEPEQSHTPPGEPPPDHRRNSAENNYFSQAHPSAYDTSPPFGSNVGLNFGSSAIPPIDPGLFGAGGHEPTSPIRDMFKSSGSGQDMFGEMMDDDDGGGQAEEALAVTEGGGYAD